MVDSGRRPKGHGYGLTMMDASEESGKEALLKIKGISGSVVKKDFSGCQKVVKKDFCGCQKMGTGFRQKCGKFCQKLPKSCQEAGKRVPKSGRKTGVFGGRFNLIGSRSGGSSQGLKREKDGTEKGDWHRPLSGVRGSESPGGLTRVPTVGLKK